MDTEEEAPIRGPQQPAISSAGADQSEDPATAGVGNDDRPAIATATDVALEQDA